MVIKDATIGLDPALVKKIDWELAQKRILSDIKSDFVFAPHFAAVYIHSFDKLKNELRRLLKDGNFAIGFPITLDVPKVATCYMHRSKRIGPNFTRPGSILYPKDRLLYQILADQIAPIINKNTDVKRSFSHQLLKDDPDGKMFIPTRYCWNKMQSSVSKLVKSKKYPTILKSDVANYFANINQHTLVNDLEDYGVSAPVKKCLEKMLTHFTGGERSSRGIIQGVYPSDLIGNFYLRGIDQFFEDLDMPSIRYVDDTYVFLPQVSDLQTLFPKYIERLRDYDLALNESKTGLYRADRVIQQDFELNDLFEFAREEFQELFTEIVQEGYEVETDYGFQTIWEEVEIEPEEDEVKLAATEKLFDRILDFPENKENIERFCLPLFSKVRSDYAVSHVVEQLNKTPAMSQIYCSYISMFLDKKSVQGVLNEMVLDHSAIMFDWQLMWILAALVKGRKGNDSVAKSAIDILLNSSRHDAVKAIAAIYVAKFGKPDRRKSLTRASINIGSHYVQTAILFGSIYFPKVERQKLQKALSGQSDLHQLVSESVNSLAGD